MKKNIAVPFPHPTVYAIPAVVKGRVTNVHVAAAIRSGATPVHGVQMMNKINATI
jgi:hypothetical protein